MKINSNLSGLLTLFCASLFFAGCDKDDETPPPTDTVTQMIEQVRELTLPLRDHQAALEEGWDTDISGCVQHPTEGGMGHHFGRMPFFDEVVDHLEPEVLLFIPDENGDMELLGVEYIVPFEAHGPDEEPPVLFNQTFHANHEQEIWALHVWTEKENPKGLFYDWNPTVSCQ